MKLSSTQLSHIARPYAKAVFALCVGSKNGEKSEASFESWEEVLYRLKVSFKSEQIVRFFAQKQPKAELTSTLFDLAEPQNSEQENFLKLLIQAKRLIASGAIYDQFKALSDAFNSVLEVGVLSAFELTDSQQQTLQDQLEKQSGQKVQLSAKTDKSLVAGVILKVGDLVIDHSLQAQMRSLSQNLIH